MDTHNRPGERLIDTLFDDTERMALQTALGSNDFLTLKMLLDQKGVATQSDVDDVLAELTNQTGDSVTQDDVAPVLALDQIDADTVDWIAPMRAEADKKRRYGIAVLMVASYLKTSGGRVTPDHFKEMVEMTYGILEGLFR